MTKDCCIAPLSNSAAQQHAILSRGCSRASQLGQAVEEVCHERIALLIIQAQEAHARESGK
jgi:hypothetical protein